jgi:hypothetical protein
MSWKMKNFSARIVLDLVAFLAISAGYLFSRAVSKARKNHDGMI